MPDRFTEPFSPLEVRERRSWTPILIGIGIVLLIVAGIAVFSRQGKNPATTPDPYAQKLQVSQIQISRANNFVGATVTYLDCRVTNTGNKTVIGGQAELIFHNTLQEVVQKEVVPIRVLQTSKLGGYVDVADLSVAPFSPGQTQNIRLVLEHLSSDWNRNFPDMRFVNLRYR